LKQGRCNDFDKLSGTIADCKISKNRKFITKKIRQDTKENDINQLYISSVINSWTEAIIQKSFINYGRIQILLKYQK